MTLTNQFSTNASRYLSVAQKSLNFQIHDYHVDFSHGETQSGRIIYCGKDVLPQDEIFLALALRLMLLEEEWTDLESYTTEDLKRFLGLLDEQYSNTEFISDVSFGKDQIWHFTVPELTSVSDGTVNPIVQVWHDGVEITVDEFRRANPFINAEIVHIAQSKFRWLMDEFYVTTNNHYILYNWYTTA